MDSKKRFEALIAEVLKSGAHKAAIINTSKIKTDRSFRDICASNACGMYGRCYTCPPDAGDIDELMQKVTDYRYGLVYQTVSALEDCYDFEGMMAAKKSTASVAQRLQKLFAEQNVSQVLHLGAGGCGICEQCAKATGEPCRFPALAMPSLETYGVHVSELAKAAGMQYINGQDTVTYFGLVLFSLDEEIQVTVNGTPVIAKAQTVLSEIVSGEKPCGGHGKCGKCKVRVTGRVSEPGETELALLSGEELKNGVRLACRTYALGECEIETLRHAGKLRVVTEGEFSPIALDPIFKNYAVALDLGTTTIAAKLYDNGGNLLSSVAMRNPQHPWGTDVISRIESALGGKARQLAASVKEAINSAVSDLAAIAKIQSNEIDGLVITGNTVMLSLLTEQSMESFSHAPFAAERLFGDTVRATELELRALATDAFVYFPPCISAFVGADTTCALLAAGLWEEKTAMLVDIGTNGEMVLFHDGRLTACSTAAGPAFEGVGISKGMMGVDGAIDQVSVAGGSLQAHVIGEGEPLGICGSGLVDAAACMLDLGAMDESGYLEDGRFAIKGTVSLTQKDIRMLQLAKSAICAGIMTMLESEKLSPLDVSALYIAGGFGNYLNQKSAVRIGLLPQMLVKNTKTVGNAALAGASMLLLDAGQKTKAEAIAKKASTLELSSNQVFSDYYMSGMLFEKQ